MRARLGFAVVIALVVTALVATLVVAQSPNPQASSAFTDLENEALAQYHEGRMITARRLAEEILDEDADSLVGHYVLGASLRENEGIHARAMYHLGRARELYETTWPVNREHPDAPWELHRDILFAIVGVAAEMEAWGYELQVIDFYDAIFDPDLDAQRAWALMQQGHPDEARESAQRAVEGEDPWFRQLGLNVLCAIEGEAQLRRERFDACIAAIDLARRRLEQNPDIDPESATNITTHAYNASLASLSVLDYQAAEDLAGEGATRFAFTAANPWRLLVRIYTDQGRMEEAVNALREMRRWQARQPPQLRDQDRAETDATLATALLVAGETEAALRLIDRSMDYPDRRGLVTTHAEQTQGAHALLRRAIRQAHEQILAEEASYAEDAPGGLRGVVGRLGRRLGSWPDDERLRNVLSDGDRLRDTLRIYVHGGIEPVPTWMVGDLVEVLGAGVVSAALDDVREIEEDLRFDAFYTAIEVDVAFARSQWGRCVESAETALAELPEPEVLLRARVAYRAAACARRSGDMEQYMALIAEGMQLDRGTLRRLDMTLPVELAEADGVGGEAMRLLRRSPRLELQEGGFRIGVTGEGTTTQLCLRESDDSRIVCTALEPEEDEIAAAYTRRLVDEFHALAFAPPLGISSQELGSLDGRVTLSSEAARDSMTETLQNIVDSVD